MLYNRRGSRRSVGVPPTHTTATDLTCCSAENKSDAGVSALVLHRITVRRRAADELTSKQPKEVNVRMSIFDSIKDALGRNDDAEEATENTLSELEDLPQTASLEGEEAGGDLLAVVESSQGGFEKLMRKIPGYHGYKEKELRREADKLLRVELAGRFDDQRKRLVELQQELVSQAMIEFLDDLERAAMKLQLLIDRIKTASYGYAGLFDAVKIKEEQLDALYEFDNKMLDFVDDVAADLDRVASAVSEGEGIGSAIRTMVGSVEDANQAFGHREETILQAGTH